MDKKAILKKYMSENDKRVNPSMKLSKDGPSAFSALGSVIKSGLKSIPGVKKAVNAGRQVIKDRIQAQKNFENRKDNSNYYKGYKSFVK